MKHSSPKRFLFILLLCGSIAYLLPEGATAQKARVSSVTDGDTFKIGVRLIGVDTPETRHPGKSIEFFGKEAGQFLRKLILGKTVRLEFGRVPTDKYGRILAYAFLPEGEFINALLVSEGFARAVPYPPNLKYADLFRKIERRAKAGRKGIWSRFPGKKNAFPENRPLVIGNQKSRIYHILGGTHFNRMRRSQNRVEFSSEKEAKQRGFKKARR
jgi:micrococcal nuclease